MSSNPRSYYLFLIFWVGFAALIYQLYSVRVLFMFFVENTYAVALTLAAFLGGLAFSSLLFSRISYHNTRNLFLLRWMMLAAAFYGYFILSNYHWIPLFLDHINQAIAWQWLVITLKYAIIAFYLFLPAFFMGGAFPLVNGLYLHSLEDSTRETGTVYFWDTLGAIFGALVAGFLLLPIFGLRVTVMLAVAVNLLLATMLMPSRFSAYTVISILLIAFTVEAHRYLGSPDRYFQVTRTGHIIPVMPELDRRFGSILFQEESPFGRITVGEQDNIKTLFVNHRSMCSSNEHSSQELARLLLPVMPPDSHMLNIGLGCGLTAAELAISPRTRQLDLIEINPVMQKAAEYFRKENHNVLNRTNVSLHIRDGADWLRNTKEKYEAILIDIEEVSVIYSSPLFTKEYFEISRERLKEGGIFALWSFTVNPEFSRVLYNTLHSVFPYVQMYHYRLGSTTYYASMRPLGLKAEHSDDLLELSESMSKNILSLTNDEINTIGHPVLEKYYSSNRIFSLPENYREPFVK